MPQHIIQRGTNRQKCFASEEDFAAYAHWLDKYAKKYSVAIHSWVFMTHHVHLLVTPDTETGVSKMIQTLGRHYVRYFNHTYRRTGTLWEGRFKSCVIDEENYLLTCQRYIELNPLRAGMVAASENYHGSSFRANGLGQYATMWTPHRVYQSLGKSVDERASAYRALFTGHLEPDMLAEIRQASNQGMALGNDRFKKEVEMLSGRRVTPLKRGPKPKRTNCDEFLH
jgi:putative transposase